MPKGLQDFSDASLGEGTLGPEKQGLGNQNEAKDGEAGPSE